MTISCVKVDEGQHQTKVDEGQHQKKKFVVNYSLTMSNFTQTLCHNNI